MSLFGDSRAQTPQDMSLNEDDLDNPTDQSSIRQSSADERPAKVSQPTDHQSEDQPDDEIQSVADTDADLIARKPSKTIISRYRRWYYNELNLLDAFETAAANDLAHNLLGLAMEKRVHLRLHEAQSSDDWTAIARTGDENMTETLRRSQAWAAWPCSKKELPEGVTGFVAWDVDNAIERSSKKQKTQHAGEEVEEALFVVGLEAAREQTADHNQLGKTLEVPAVPTRPGPMMFSADEEISVKLLRPAAREVLDKMERLFAALKPLKRPRKGKTGLVDWSDVLNSAQSLEWNTQTVQATAARCSAMFGEPRKPRGDVSMRAKPAMTSTGGKMDLTPEPAVDDVIREYEI